MNKSYQDLTVTHLLLECIDYMKKHNIYVSPKFINNFVSLNESVISTITTPTDISQQIWPVFESNKYAYLTRVSDILNDFDTSVVSLNESMNQDIHTSQEYDIQKFKRYINKLVKELKSQNDFDRLDPDIIKIKQSLNASLYVKGLDVNHIHHDLSKITQHHIISLVYDKSYDRIIIVFKEGGVSVYDINTDIFGSPTNFYNDNNAVDIRGINVNKIKLSEICIYLKSKIHNNLISIYTDLDELGLKYSDNLYKDNERRNNEHTYTGYSTIHT